MHCHACYQMTYPILQVHKHSKRLNHMPVQMKTVSDLSQYGEEGSILRLRGLLTVRDDHYTSLSEPPGAEATNSQWLHFNPQAAEKGKMCFQRIISFFMLRHPKWILISYHNDRVALIEGYCRIFSSCVGEKPHL